MRRRPPGTSSVAVHVWPVLVIAFLAIPILLATIVAFSSGDRLEFPIPGFSLRWFEAASRNAQFLEGLLNSLVVALSSAALATVAGTGAAIAFNHYRFTGRAAAQLAVMLPVSLPAIVLGLGLLFVLPSYGLRPGLLIATLGHATLGIPYVVAMVTAALANYDRALERASANLGVGPVRTFFRITLPLIRGGIIAGAISAFLISLDNVSLSLFITRGDTLPLRLMQQLLFYADPSIAAVSTIVLGVSLFLLVLVLPVALLRRSGEQTE
jgi:putative spermidine/putrescine transport system permease protein